MQTLAAQVADKLCGTVGLNQRCTVLDHIAVYLLDILGALGCQVIIQAIEGDYLRSDLRNPFSYVELMQLQRALSRKASGDDTDVAVLMKEVKELLKLNDKTAIF